MAVARLVPMEILNTLTPQALADTCSLSVCVFMEDCQGTSAVSSHMPPTLAAPSSASAVQSAVLSGLTRAPGQDSKGMGGGRTSCRVFRVSSTHGNWRKAAGPGEGTSHPMSDSAVAAAMLRTLLSAAPDGQQRQDPLRFLLPSTQWEQGAELRSSLPRGLGESKHYIYLLNYEAIDSSLFHPHSLTHLSIHTSGELEMLNVYFKDPDGCLIPAVQFSFKPGPGLSAFWASGGADSLEPAPAVSPLKALPPQVAGVSVRGGGTGSASWQGPSRPHADALAEGGGVSPTDMVSTEAGSGAACPLDISSKTTNISKNATFLLSQAYNARSRLVLANVPLIVTLLDPAGYVVFQVWIRCVNQRPPQQLIRMFSPPHSSYWCRMT